VLAYLNGFKGFGVTRTSVDDDISDYTDRQ
jgi:hypothetical protein